MTRIVKHIDLGVVPYGQALALQYNLRERLMTDEKESVGYLISLEHPLTVTLGKRGDVDALLGKEALKHHQAGVYKIDRGGQATLHNPGQLVLYPVLRLQDYGLNVVDLVRKTAYAVIDTLAHHDIESTYDDDLPGVWAEIDSSVMAQEGYTGLRRRKIASVGMKITRGISTHGVAINVVNDLRPFSWIMACGLSDPPMAKVTDLYNTEFATFKEELLAAWEVQFGVERVTHDEPLPLNDQWVPPLDGWDPSQ